MRRILMGAVGTTILAAVVTVGAIATSAPKQAIAKGGWGSHSGGSSVAAAASRAQAPSDAGDFSTILHVVLRQANIAFLDSNPQGARGDQLVVAGPVLKPNTNDPDKIGLFSVRCQSTIPNKGLFDCNITFNIYGAFPHGASITVQGPSSDSTSWINAVTGGSRRFANVTGQVRFDNIEGTDDVDAWFYLNDVM